MTHKRPAILVVLADHAGSSVAVHLLEELRRAGYRLLVVAEPGADRWYGSAALEAAMVRTQTVCDAVEPVAAVLLVGDVSMAQRWRHRWPEAHLLPVEAGEHPTATCSNLSRALSAGRLRGRRVLVTAGPTVEHFDAVRYLSNPSSGKMGYAVAAAAWSEGAEVVLVSGPTALATPHGVARISVTSASEMRAEVLRERYDVVFKAAAVSDYRPASRAAGKVKKSEGPWVLEMERTPDILAELAASPLRPAWLVGFAAETEDLERYARGKLSAKALDGIVANDVGAGGAFGSDRNRVECYDASGRARVIGPDTKEAVAAGIVAWAAEGLARKA